MSEKSKDLATYLSRDQHYLLACSYGPDSMALFHLLLKEGYSFDAAHVNYHLRDSSDMEESSLRKVCLENGVNIHVHEVEKGAIKGNIEGICREIRYDFFSNLAREYHFDAVLIAHQEDDLLETYLLQIDRNSIVDFYGLKAESTYKGVRVIRPLLGYTKEELKEICDANGIPYSIDASNSDISYKRNKIRHQVVAPMSREDRDRLLLEIDKKNAAHDDLVCRLKSLDLHKSEMLLSLTEEELQNALILLLLEVGIYYPLSEKNAQNIKKALLSEKPNIRIKLKDFYFEKSYGECRFFIEDNTSYCYEISGPSLIDTEYFHFDLVNTDKFEASPGDYPLTIRNSKPDDLIQIDDYMVKVSRLFIDWKMPLKYRSRWPIIVNNQGRAIYIPRYQKDFKSVQSENFYVKL